MKNGLKRTAALCCLLLTALSALSPIATALSGKVEGITNAVVAPEHELSVMSFNILDYEGTGVFAKPAERAPMAVKTIAKYMPDLIGIQEAGDPENANDKFDWNDYLVTELAKLGYGCRYLTQESVKPSSMTIGAGLMIFYKKERFDLIDHGSAQYKTSGSNGVYASYEGFSRVDGSRYYHWVKLWDKQQKTYIYQFNTHLAVPPSSLTQNGKTATDAQRSMLANIIRTISARQLADAMEKLAENYPCFATGDYNASWSRSVEGDSNSSQLYELTKNGIFSAAADDAYNRISCYPNTIIDHVFYNTYHADALTYRGVYEEYGGIQVSDHMAMMAYFDLTPPITFASGSYDPVSRTLTDSTEETSYTFNISELHKALHYKIFDENGQQVDNTVDLTCSYNRYTIELYNEISTGSSSTPYCTINATILCTANIPVTLTADNAENVYYTDGAYHVVLKDTVQSLNLITENGRLFTDAACTHQLPLPLQPADGTTTYYLRTISTGEIFPVYIHRETVAAESGKVLYVDDDIGNTKGTVAFSIDDEVILAESGVNGFATLAAAAAVANKADGYTVYVAPGTYSENTVTFSKNITLLGNNADISPLIRADAGWSLAEDRREETIINTQLNFSRNAPVFTVRGFTFIGNGTYSYVINQSNSNINNAAVLNIAQNIFRFAGKNTVNSSCIMLNTATHKSGIIRDNYFEAVNERAETMARYLTVRNPDGLIFEENYCVNFTDQANFISSEVSDKNLTDAGNCNITFRYNRFDNCNPITFLTQFTDSSTSVNIQILYNDFVKCGNLNTDYALKFYLSNDNTFVTDYSKFDINIFGNRFLGCRRAVYLSRGSSEGDITQARLTINQNRFIDMQQGRKDVIQLYFNVYNDTQIEATSPNWDFSHNYFTSDTVSGHRPDSFVNTLVTYNDASVSCVNLDLFSPYYTNPELTWLYEGVIKDQSGIVISNNTHSYDGQPHSLNIDAGEGAVISYSTDPSANRFYSLNKPTLTEPGILTVYYQVERKGYTNFEGRALITVRVPNRTLKMDSLTLPFDDQPHSLEPVYEPIAGDQVSYVCNGVEFPTMPSFVNAGSYTVTINIENEYADPKVATATATLTITPGEITGVTLEVTHEILLSGTAEGDTVLYSVDGGTPSAAKPTLTGNEQSITVTVSRKGHNDLVLMTRPQETSPFNLRLTKVVEGEDILWQMRLVPDREMLRTQNITLLSYGFATAETAEKILKGEGTLTTLRENETGILSMEDEVIFTTSASAPTAAYATYIKDGAVYTVYSTVGAK